MISILIPTRNRPDLLLRALESIEETATPRDSADIEIVIRADEDDAQTIEVLDIWRWKCTRYPSGSGEQHLKPYAKILVGPRYEGYKSLLRFFHECAQASSGDLIMPCNDDAIFRTKGWNIEIEEAAKGFADGIFVIGTNSIINSQAFPFGVVSRKWYELLGHIHDQRLFFGDIYIRDVIRGIQGSSARAIYLDHVIIEHAWASDRRSEACAQEIEYVYGEHVAESYRQLHQQCVQEAIEKLQPHVRRD